MADWNAQLYNKYSNERMQPVIDLINRINDLSGMKRIIDVGCGTGISTRPLRNKWPKAEIVGVDNSESMLYSAKQASPDILWLKRDCNDSLEEFGKFNLVFSNAVLQWLSDQEAVLRNLGKLLQDDGVLAVQIPNFPRMTISSCIEKAADAFGRSSFEGIERDICKCYSPHYYYDILSKYYNNIELWQTNYYHIMKSHEDILNFYKSTGLRPFLARLSADEQEVFLSEVLKEIKMQYKTQENGKVLFEFKRIFFLASQNINNRSVKH